MAKAFVKIDANMLLNMVKNDREFTITKGVPRDAYVVATEHDRAANIFNLYVEIPSLAAAEDKSIPLIEIELFGNADAVDENGELKAIKPASLL